MGLGKPQGDVVQSSSMVLLEQEACYFDQAQATVTQELSPQLAHRILTHWQSQWSSRVLASWFFYMGYVGSGVRP